MSNMNTNLSDKALVQAVLDACGLTHQALADILLVSRVAVTKMANGRTVLRGIIRQKLESMLAEAEASKEK